MKKTALVVLIGAITVILFDTVASLASRNFQLNYGLFSVGSFLIYACVGFFGAKYGSLTLATVAAALIGLIDSTLGWYISWVIGPGRIEIETTSISILIAIIFVVITASLFGFIGGLLNHWVTH